MEMYEGEPLHWFVRDASGYAHHLDYERHEYDRALCGHLFRGVIHETETRPSRVCRKCQDRMPAHEAKWWQAKAEAEARLHADTRRTLANERRTTSRLARKLAQADALARSSADAPDADDRRAALEAALAEAQAELQRRHDRIENQRTEIRRLRGAVDRLKAKAPKAVVSPQGDKKPRRRPVVAPERDGAKKRFYEKEGAPFPARIVRGGLPGLGKR